MNFGDALSAIKKGTTAARSTWDMKTWIFLVSATSTVKTPTAAAFTTGAWVAMQTSDGAIIPWQPSQYDMLAENWVIVP